MKELPTKTTCVLQEKLKLQHKGLASVGDEYCRSFLKRNNHLLYSDTGTTQGLRRKEWSNHLNITNMFNLVYNVMDEAGVLKKLEEPVWMNLNETLRPTRPPLKSMSPLYAIKLNSTTT